MIIIEESDAEGFGTGVKNAARGGNVFESAIAAIMKKPAGFAAVGFGSAVGFLLSIQAAENVMLRGPLYIIAYEQIEKTVAVVVNPKREAPEPNATGKTT